MAAEIKTWILDIIEDAKTRYLEKDYAEAGMNGPYKILETSVRTTAHWIETFVSMYRITKEQTYLFIIKRFAEYLRKCVNESENGAVISMPNNQSHTNGLIGLAWIMDGLVKAGEVLNDSIYYDAALKIYNSQRYDFNAHLWDIVDSDGKCLGKDMAFNHNLWFAVSGYRLFQKTGNKVVEKQTGDYFRYIEKHLYIYRNGLISHFITNSGSVKADIKTILRCFFCELSGAGTPWNKKNQVEYERAYHLFSMYAFSQLYLINPRLDVFNTKKFNKMKQYALNANNFYDFDDQLQYAYYYNSPAYEYPLVAKVFGETESINSTVEKFLNIHRSYIQKAKKTRMDIDYITLDARVYEMLRYYELTELEE